MNKIIIEKLSNMAEPTGEYLSNEDGSIFPYYIFNKDKTKAMQFESEILAEKKQFEMNRRRGLSSRQVIIDIDEIYRLSNSGINFSNEDIEMIKGLLNKVNAVTAFWRHQRMVPPKKLDELSNRQIEFEKHFKLKGLL